MRVATAAGCSALLLALAPGAWACGACVEDKVAATYDHAVVQGAAAQGRVVVFCELKGPIQAARIKKAAAGVPGLDLASVRVSVDPGALSFVLDPARQSPKAAVAGLQERLPGTRVSIVRTMHAKD
jgi:hypothetical protein